MSTQDCTKRFTSNSAGSEATAGATDNNTSEAADAAVALQGRERDKSC
ncbi:hypothetical protein H1Q63_17770 [Desmonostoc muscorum CCALA 125]|nr:hypothetical protein [Desmonostoc muscorum CCALA 125]